METSSPHVIVVGVDGSDRADRALQWSIDEAELRGAALRIVTAWHVPLAVYAGHGPSALPASVSLKDAVREAAEGIAETAARKVQHATDLPVETRVVEGHAADVLIDSSRGADLLALGSSSHGSVSSALTSVVVECAVHAPVPTVVIH